MTILTDYAQFDGLYWETGAVRNYYAYRGVKAPHTGEPFTEALLLGISGGAVMGYFSFAYEGYDPYVVILTRNTFDPMDTLLQRLGVPQNVRQTSKPEKGLQNLLDTLANGLPAIVWADVYRLPYNAYPPEDAMWVMMPILVYGYEADHDRVWIADRARVPLTVRTGELAAARARVKKSKFRLLTLDPPNFDKLANGVQMGIMDCLKIYTEGPPKGSKSNFGFNALQRWADLLVKPKQRQSWAKIFPPGRKMYSALTSTFNSIAIFGKEGGAERDVYADFLLEASVLLEKPALTEAAGHFWQSAAAWDDLGLALLPDEVEPFKETRELMLRKHQLFLDQGTEALEEILRINARLKDIKDQMTADFPLSEAAAQAHREILSEKVLGIAAIEQQAVDALQGAML